MRPLLLAVLLAGPAMGAETAAYLDVGAGARAVGMGGAYTALADDATSIYWNPAGMARLEKRDASVSHAELGAGNHHEFIAYAHPTSRATFGAALTYLSYGSIEGRDATGRQLGNFTASDAAFAFSAATKTDWADAGVTVKLLRSHVGFAEATGFAVDAGLRRELVAGTGKVVLGAALRNIGPGLKFDDQRNDLPLRADFGAAYRFASGHSVSAQFQNGPRGAGSEGGAGGEFKAAEGVLLRLGWTSKGRAIGGSGFDAARGLTLGLGLRRGNFALDYAAQAAGELGNTHRFTVAVGF